MEEKYVCPVCGKDEGECTCGHFPMNRPCPCPPCPPPCPPKPSTTFSTPNYHLPQWKASDVTSWLTQMNMAMMQIDTALHKLALSTGVDGVPQELIEQITKLEEAVTLLENMYTAVDNRTENLNQLVTNINTIIANLQTTMQTLTTNFVNLDTRFTTVELQASNAVEKVNKMEVNLNTTIKTVDDLKNRVVQLETTSASHQATLDAIEEEIQNLQNKNDKQDSSIGELKAADKIHDSSITELRAKNSTQDSEIELLKGRMQTAETNITVTSSSVSANTKAIETLKGVDTQLTGRLNGLDTKTDSTNTKLHTAEENINDIRGDMQELSMSVSLAGQNANEAKQTAEEAKTTADNADTKAARVESDLAQTKLDVQNIDNQVDGLRTDVDNNSDMLTTLSNSVGNMESDVSEAKSTATAAQQAAELATTAAGTVQQSLAKLQTAFDSATIPYLGKTIADFTGHIEVNFLDKNMSIYNLLDEAGHTGLSSKIDTGSENNIEFDFTLFERGLVGYPKNRVNDTAHRMVVITTGNIDTPLPFLKNIVTGSDQIATIETISYSSVEFGADVKAKLDEYGVEIFEPFKVPCFLKLHGSDCDGEVLSGGSYYDYAQVRADQFHISPVGHQLVHLYLKSGARENPSAVTIEYETPLIRAVRKKAGV